MPCPPGEEIWTWLKKNEVQEFYHVHREHAGESADSCVGAEIEFVDKEESEEEQKELPSLVNLFDPKNMALIPHG
jgi:hypothetical protein